MKESFENTLGRHYGDTAKEAVLPENLTKEGRIATQAKVSKIVEAVADERSTSPEVQKEIYDIQKKKQDLMTKLHKQFKKIDEGEKIEKQGGLPVSYDEANQKFVYKDSKGETIVLLKEDLLTDGEWGISYSLDASVPSHTKKEYVLADTKRELSRLLDNQIILDEVGNLYTDTAKKSAYEAIQSREGEQSLQSGVIAEKMVKNLLKKFSIRSGDDFEIKDANVYQDVEQKIDFIVHRKRRARAVGVEENGKTVGIQFTLNKEKTAFKERQIANSKRHLDTDIEDILLVSAEMGYAKKIYEEWSKNKKPGGPEKYMSARDMQLIFSEVMRDIMTEEEIKEVVGLNS